MDAIKVEAMRVWRAVYTVEYRKMREAGYTKSAHTSAVDAANAASTEFIESWKNAS